MKKHYSSQKGGGFAFRLQSYPIPTYRKTQIEAKPEMERTKPPPYQVPPGSPCHRPWKMEYLILFIFIIATSKDKKSIFVHTAAIEWSSMLVPSASGTDGAMAFGRKDGCIHWCNLTRTIDFLSLASALTVGRHACPSSVASVRHTIQSSGPGGQRIGPTHLLWSDNCLLVSSHNAGKNLYSTTPPRHMLRRW